MKHSTFIFYFFVHQITSRVAISPQPKIKLMFQTNDSLKPRGQLRRERVQVTQHPRTAAVMWVTQDEPKTQPTAATFGPASEPRPPFSMERDAIFSQFLIFLSCQTRWECTWSWRGLLRRGGEVDESDDRIGGRKRCIKAVV